MDIQIQTNMQTVGYVDQAKDFLSQAIDHKLVGPVLQGLLATGAGWGAGTGINYLATKISANSANTGLGKVAQIATGIALLALAVLYVAIPLTPLNGMVYAAALSIGVLGLNGAKADTPKIKEQEAAKKALEAAKKAKTAHEAAEETVATAKAEVTKVVEDLIKTHDVKEEALGDLNKLTETMKANKATAEGAGDQGKAEESQAVITLIEGLTTAKTAVATAEAEAGKAKLTDEQTKLLKEAAAAEAAEAATAEEAKK